MQSKITLLGGVAMGAALSLGFAATADAKAVKHHHHAAPAADGKVEALTQEVETLETRLEAESLAREQLQGQVQAAQSQAAAAQADADAAHAQIQEQIQTIPGVVSSAVAANKPKPTWADNTTISSRIFADISDIHQGPTPNSINGMAFDIKRAYLGVDHKFNDIYSANLTLDFAPNGTILNGGTYGTGTLQGSEVIKYAYIQAKYDPRLILQIGGAQMPWIPFSEDVYGQRYVEKTLTDTNKVANSADFGFFAHGAFLDGVLNYAVAAVDGAGYKNDVRSKGMDVEGRVNVAYKGFVAAVGGYTGEESKDFQASVVTSTTHATATRIDALAAYANPLFHVGVEYFEADNWKSLTATAPRNKDKQEGYSVFATYNAIPFLPKFSVFARYDWGKPSETLASSANLQYYNIGIQYEPVKIVDLALVYKHDEINHAPAAGFSYQDANTTLVAPANGTAKYDEIGLFAQYRY
ncbi:MAG: hypothetical protein JO303_16370 [Caulobacteraceae bacterium]|nr:hypothetical protein [Caulobacteraceae bacterium]